MSSGAEYLTTSPDGIVFGVPLSLNSSEILAIPKSQICGSPFPVGDQPLFYETCQRRTHLVRDKHVFLRALSQEAFTEGDEKTHAFDCVRCQIVHTH